MIEYQLGSDPAANARQPANEPGKRAQTAPAAGLMAKDAFDFQAIAKDISAQVGPSLDSRQTPGGVTTMASPGSRMKEGSQQANVSLTITIIESIAIVKPVSQEQINRWRHLRKHGGDITFINVQARNAPQRNTTIRRSPGVQTIPFGQPAGRPPATGLRVFGVIAYAKTATVDIGHLCRAFGLGQVLVHCLEQLLYALRT